MMPQNAVEYLTDELEQLRSYVASEFEMTVGEFVGTLTMFCQHLSYRMFQREDEGEFDEEKN